MHLCALRRVKPCRKDLMSERRLPSFRTFEKIFSNIFNKENTSASSINVEYHEGVQFCRRGRWPVLIRRIDVGKDLVG